MRSTRWIKVLLVVVAVCLVYLLLSKTFEWVGGGSLPVEVMIEVDKPIRHVTYASCRVGEQGRRRIEEAADPKRFDYLDEAQQLSANRYAAKVRADWHSRFIFFEVITHFPQIVVYVEFKDGSRACRVIDLPDGSEFKPFVIDLR
jgi:hypothetical protein